MPGIKGDDDEQPANKSAVPEQSATSRGMDECELNRVDVHSNMIAIAMRIMRT